MQKIAEYFRDLAAEDRYFGAEPPTPDAEMLHQIAEREINRRVEARLDKQGLVLRAAEEPAAQPAPISAPAPQTATPAPSPVAEAPPAPQPAPEAAPEVAEADSVAMKLQRIRAAVANARAASARQASYDDEFAETIDEPVSGAAPAFDYAIDMGGPLHEDETEVEVEVEENASDEAPAEVTEEAAETEEVAAEPAPAEVMPEVEAPVAEEPAETEAPQPNLSAGRLARAQRRQALRRAAIAEAAREALILATEPTPEPVEASAEAAPAEAVIEEPETEAEMTAVEPEAEVVEDEAFEDELEAEDEVEAPEAASENDAEEIQAEADWAEFEDDLEAEALDAEDEPADTEFADAVYAEDIDLDTITAALAGPVETLDAEPEAAQAEAPEQEPEQEPVRARVIKVRRVEPLILDAGEAQAPGTIDADEMGAFEAPEPVLSPEDEAELMRELAEVEEDAGDAPVAVDFEEAELAEDVNLEAEAFEDEAFDVEEADEEAPAAALDEDEGEDAIYATLPLPEKEPRTRTEPEGTDHENELTRLMEEAESRGATEETRRRFSAIAHLKAAVAATVADRRSRGDDKGAAPTDETRDYRADLNKAVRPRRPVVTGGARTERPSVEPKRPAPLVLVSAQRIDHPEAEAAPAEPAPVRPRRIAAVELQAATPRDEIEATPPLSAEEATSFAEFAESRDTQGLAELLEAAAAYTSQIEGRPHFSPPQIMRKVSSLDEGADFSREDRLRVFGTLLRQGKITKVKRGQYAIAEASRFYAEAKQA
ncbi:hypothetical protein CLN94_03195 [Pseudothioclava arenosa]|uniref:Uncharacterized protein n=2 Tax=Pseudothioclava arenosa TaxID=1795308 RepID=A0A2A4CTR1_9RHOB|nr:hypothetical protein CLN94_03195 [Pseudothioclava arenosa]